MKVYFSGEGGRRTLSSGFSSIVIAPAGHPVTHTPQPMQRSRLIVNGAPGGNRVHGTAVGADAAFGAFPAVNDR